VNKDEVLGLLQGGKIVLRPSQERISFPIVHRIYKKLKIGLKFDSIQVAEKSIIVNGHHRYLASLPADVKIERVECPLTSAKKVTKWEVVELVDEDWDTVDHIKSLNEQDAHYNEIPLEKLMELIA